MQDLEYLNNSYIIIGPPNSKKSEISLNLSKILNYKLINLDRDKYRYFSDFTDFDENKYINLLNNDKNKALYYIHKYEMNHLNNILDNNNSNIIMDFGNTYTIIDNNDILNKIKLYKNIILLKSSNIPNNLLDKKLYKNKILLEISTIIINIDNKSSDSIINEILNYNKFKEIL